LPRKKETSDRGFPWHHKGHFPFDKEFHFEFPVFGVSAKEGKLAKFTEIVRNFSPGIYVPFDFPPGISGIFG